MVGFHILRGKSLFSVSPYDWRPLFVVCTVVLSIDALHYLMTCVMMSLLIFFVYVRVCVCIHYIFFDIALLFISFTNVFVFNFVSLQK